MRDLRELDEYRYKEGEQVRYKGYGGRKQGVFIVPYKQTLLRIIADTGQGWDHISISLSDRTPTWDEMEHVKRLFFKPHECAVQYHVPVEHHINTHPNCLHIWRPYIKSMPRPPKDRV